MTGRFITLEGGEGTGKSTLQRALADALQREGRSVVTTREPGGTPVAETIREIALARRTDQPLSSITQAVLMNAARSDHLDHVIRPALARGDWIICDRFMDSTMAYQSADGGASREDLEALERVVVGDSIPDLTLILDAAPQDLLARRILRGGREDVFEAADLAFHEHVRTALIAIAEDAPERCVVIAADQSEAQVLADAMEAIRKRFGDVK